MAPTLLWFSSDTLLGAETELPELATRFDVSQVATLPDAAQALASEEFDCILVNGPLADSSRLEALEVLHRAGGQTPIVCAISAEAP